MANIIIEWKIHMLTILRYLFITSLITFPLGQVARVQLSNDINVTLFDICVVVTGIFWLYVTHKTNSYKTGSLAKPICIFLLTICLSLFANIGRYPLTDMFVAVLYAVRWLLFASLYFVIGDIPEPYRKRVPDLLIASGAVVLIFGYLQYFLYGNLRNLYYLGWDEHLARMFSSFLDPNFFGAFLVLYFLFILGHAVVKQNKKTVRFALLTLLTTASFIGIFLTTSRSAMLMLLVGLITYLVLIGKARWILAFIGTLIIIFVLTSRFFFIENVNPFRVASSLARIDTGIHAVEIIQKNSILGVGFNAYRYAQYQYGFRDKVTEYPNHADSGTDTSLLFVFATTGIIGFLSYLYLLMRVYRLGRSRQSLYGQILTASLVGLLVNSLFINSLFYPLIMYWVWVLSGITDYT